MEMVHPCYVLYMGGQGIYICVCYVCMYVCVVNLSVSGLAGFSPPPRNILSSIVSTLLLLSSRDIQVQYLVLRGKGWSALVFYIYLRGQKGSLRFGFIEWEDNPLLPNKLLLGRFDY